MKKKEMQQRVKCNQTQNTNLNILKDKEQGEQRIGIDSIR
jgi:hypothetical protein